MKIYEVIPIFNGSAHVVVAKNESEAIKTTVDYLNQFQTGHLFKPDDFCASDIDADKFSEPTIIN